MPRPRIVVLDGHTTNPGDLSWAPLATLGELIVHERSPEQLGPRCRGAAVVLTNKTVLGSKELEQFVDLRLISVLATGTNVVDLQAARRCGVVVCNVPEYSTASVVQHVFALLLSITNRVKEHSDAVLVGAWQRSADFSLTLSRLTELEHKTLGIIGLGAIGQRVAIAARALGMKVLAAHQRSMQRISNEGVAVTWLALDELLERSDVISLHCPLSAETEGLIDASRLRKVKPGAILINTGRGPLIDERAVADALFSGRLGGFAADVLSTEPPSPDNPLLHAPHAVITPHIAWATPEARRRLIQVSAENVQAFLNGSAQNVVNE